MTWKNIHSLSLRVTDKLRNGMYGKIQSELENVQKQIFKRLDEQCQKVYSNYLGDFLSCWYLSYLSIFF